MPETAAPLERIIYSKLNSRQKENFNFQKLSAVLADYGFATLRLSDDWRGADFIASHIHGDHFLKVQLKGRLTLDTKYRGKNIWIAFRHKERWYMYPHDEALKWAKENMSIGATEVWDSGARLYSYPGPPKRFLLWLQQYAL